MSFILKALQKLEEENAGRPAEPAAIESAIIAPATRSTAAPRRMLKWLVLVLGFIAGGIMTYLLMPKATIPIAQRQRTAVAPTVPAAPAPAATPVTPTTPSAPAIQVLPTTPVAQADMPSPKGVPGVEGNAPSAGSDSGRQAVRRRSRARDAGEDSPPDGVALPGPAPQALPADASTAQLAVNGIAFQDDPAASAAVVNGVYVKRGMTVGGARVERIFQDKVRFSRNGATFEVPLSK